MLILELKLRKIIREIIENDELLNEAGAAGSNATTAAAPQGETGLILGNKTKQFYSVTSAQIKSSDDFIHPTQAGVENCSEWAKKFVGWQGNAWIANRTGTLKFNAFSNIGSYQASAAKLFGDMNTVKNLNSESTKAFNSKVKEIVSNLLPEPASLANLMQIGDVVGMYYKGSEHHGEAFFESCSGWSLATSSQVVSTCVKDIKENLWNSQMMGKKLKFTIISPFSMNTHLGFVGGMIDGDPIIFHNMNGDVHISRLSKITSAKCYPVWIKQGDYSGKLASGPMSRLKKWLYSL